MTRPLSVTENKAILKLIKGLNSEDQSQITVDLENCTVDEIRSGGARRLTFNINGYERPSYHGQHGYFVEGTVNDTDGVKITVYLYADENHRLLELELLRWADNHGIVDPVWDTFEVLY